MTTRDTLEHILEIHDECKKLEDKITRLFNKIYAEHLQKAADKSYACDKCGRECLPTRNQEEDVFMLVDGKLLCGKCYTTDSEDEKCE